MLVEAHERTIHTDVLFGLLKEVGRRGVGGTTQGGRGVGGPQTHHTHGRALRAAQGGRS